MNSNYYIRSINPDGTGDVVMPEMEQLHKTKPICILGIYPCTVAGNKRCQCKEFNDWEKHLSSIPSVGIATKELTEANRIGFVKECEVGYQVWCREVGVDDGRYYTVSKRFYNSPLNEGSRRLVLSLPKNAEEETVTLTRKQVSEIFSDENLAVKLPYFNTDAQNDACVKGAEFVINQINNLFKK